MNRSKHTVFTSSPSEWASGATRRSSEGKAFYKEGPWPKYSYHPNPELRDFLMVIDSEGNVPYFIKKESRGLYTIYNWDFTPLPGASKSLEGAKEIVTSLLEEEVRKS